MKQQCAAAKLANADQVMGYKENSFAPGSKLLYPFKAFPTKLSVPNGQYLVDEEDVRINLGRDGEGQSHVHAGRILLYRYIDEFT